MAPAEPGKANLRDLYLLDTNVCIHILADANSRAAHELQFHPRETVGVSAITVAELMVGFMREIRAHPEVEPRIEVHRKINAFFDRVPIYAFDRTAAAYYAEIPHRRHRFDHLIAAHARALGAVLVTANAKDFAQIPKLRIVDWSQ